MNKRNLKKRENTFFFRIFPINVNSTMSGNGLYKKKYLCFEGIKNSGKSECSSLEQRSGKLWKLRSANHVKFTEKCMMCTEVHVLAKKMFTNGLNINFLRQDEKTINGVETHWLTGEENFSGAMVSKSQADSFLKWKYLIVMSSMKKLQL